MRSRLSRDSFRWCNANSRSAGVILFAFLMPRRLASYNWRRRPAKLARARGMFQRLLRALLPAGTCDPGGKSMRGSKVLPVVMDCRNWGERRGLNPRPSVPQTDALPAELRSPPSDSSSLHHLKGAATASVCWRSLVPIWERGHGIELNYFVRMKKRLRGGDTSKSAGIGAGWSASKMDGIGPRIALSELFRAGRGIWGERSMRSMLSMVSMSLMKRGWEAGAKTALLVLAGAAVVVAPCGASVRTGWQAEHAAMPQAAAQQTPAQAAPGQTPLTQKVGAVKSINGNALVLTVD